MGIFGFGKKTVQESERSVTVTEMANLLLTIPELAEAYTRADIELALDDKGWLSTRSAVNNPDLMPETRVQLLGRSRLYWLRDPLAKQAVRLWTDYAMGTGITVKHKDKSKQKTLDEFMKDRRNRRVLSSEGQRKSSKKLLVDGEVFFAIFTDADGKKVIRWVDPVQITDIITDPEDSEHILAYRRQLPAKPGEQSKALFYADWTADEEDRNLAQEQKVGHKQEEVKLEEDVVLYHLPFDTLYQRGNGLLSTVVDWSREHRRFMEARVAITQALSKYAYKLSVKGGQAAVNAVKTKLQSTYANTSSNTVEKNPQTAAGGSFVRNDGIDLEAVPRATGAGDAQADGNQLKLMVSSGTGIMLHYFGDPSTGNLATATAMELPMLKQFESYQELWKDAYTDLLTIVLDEDNADGAAEAAPVAPPKPPKEAPPTEEESDDDPLTVELPPILADDLTALGSAFNSFATLWPELADEDEVLTMVLTAMRVSNVEKVLKNMRQLREKQKTEDAAKEEKMAKLIGQANPAGADPKAPMQRLNPKEANELTTALVKLAESLGQ